MLILLLGETVIGEVAVGEVVNWGSCRLGKLSIGEVADGEVVYGEVVMGKLRWGNNLTPIFGFHVYETSNSKEPIPRRGNFLTSFLSFCKKEYLR